MKHQATIDELKALLDALIEKKSAVIDQAVEAIAGALETGHKVLIFGNGGSAAEAQHFAAELVNKFMKERKGLPAIALTTDTAALTSIANDMKYDRIFSRQVEALGTKGDAAIGLSTSGNSPNVVEGIREARERGLVTVVLTGAGGGKLAGLADVLLDVPSKSTPRIQEAHLLLLHILAAEIDKRF
ncbi:MAG: SIS domain-containing protein [Candidatus Aminicenantales bacterium]